MAGWCLCKRGCLIQGQCLEKKPLWVSALSVLPWISEALLLLHVGVFSLHRKEEPGRKIWEGREAGLPWRVTDGGTQQGFPPLSCDLAGAGQDPGGEKFSAPLASTEVSLSRVGLHFYVCVPLISLLDSMCSFTHSLIFSNNIHCSQYS